MSLKSYRERAQRHSISLIPLTNQNDGFGNPVDGTPISLGCTIKSKSLEVVSDDGNTVSVEGMVTIYDSDLPSGISAKGYEFTATTGPLENGSRYVIQKVVVLNDPLSVEILGAKVFYMRKAS